MRILKYVGIIFIIVFLGYLFISGIFFTSITELLYNYQESELPSDIVFITIESLRADNLQCYGYQRNTSSNICKVANDGVVFENAYSQGTHTPIALPSLLTSSPPNLVGLEGGWVEGIPDEVTIFPEVLKAEGYEGFGNLGKAIVKANLAQGMSYGQMGVNEMSRKIESEKKTNTFFWNFRFVPHVPFNPPKKYREWGEVNYTIETLNEIQEGFYRGISSRSPEKLENLTHQDLVDLYDSEIYEADEKYVKPIINSLKDTGLYEDSLIIITGDHGVSLGEQGYYGHGMPPYEEQIHVPLIIKFPENEHSDVTIEQPVNHIDILPTIYDFMGIEGGTKNFGESLIPAIEQGKDLERPVYATRSTPPGGEDWTYREGPYKYMLFGEVKNICVEGKNIKNIDETYESYSEKLFNLEKDPKESTNIIKEEYEKARELREKLCEIYRIGHENRYEPEKTELTDATEEKLRELGYLD